MSKQRAAYTRTKTVKIKGNKIYYYLKHDGVADVCDYNDDLRKILTDRRLHPFRDDGRLRFNISVGGGVIHRCYLYDLAIGCYNGAIHYDSFIDDLQNYYNNKSEMTVDHADGNIHNQTKSNLSFMSKELNLSKGGITRRTKLPSGIVTAYVDGKYRVEFVSAATDLQALVVAVNQRLADIGIKFSVEHTGQERAVERYLCDTPEDFVDCLKWIITTSREWTNTIKPQGGTYINKDNPCYSDELKEAIAEQERVAALPVEAFQRWKAK